MSCPIASKVFRRALLVVLFATALPAFTQAWVPIINKYSDISLGSIVPGATAGTVVLNSPSGSRTVTGSANLASSAGVSLGSFTLTGKVGDTWSAAAGSALPFTLAGPGGATLLVTAVDCQPGATGTFPSGSTTGFYYLGATLSVGTSATTPAGTYTGSYSLNVTDPFKGSVSTMIFMVQARVDPVITLSELTGLRFGDIFTGPAPGTVVLSPSGARSTTGGAGLGSISPFGPATFIVTGAGNATYAITLPTSILLGSPDGTLTISPVTSSPNLTGLLDATGRQTLGVGGTLNVPANQPDGDYTGTFSVTVAYN